MSFLLLPRIEDCDALLVLDAAHLDAAPGDIRCLEGAAMDEFLRTARCSVHEVGVRDLLDVARLTGHLPERRAFVGVQPLEIGWGDALSDPVAGALPGGGHGGTRNPVARWQRHDTATHETALISRNLPSARSASMYCGRIRPAARLYASRASSRARTRGTGRNEPHRPSANTCARGA